MCTLHLTTAPTEHINMYGVTAGYTLFSSGTAITFGTITGHTVDDQWFYGFLVDEPCTESTNTAQITDTTHRLINPNTTPMSIYDNFLFSFFQ